METDEIFELTEQHLSLLRSTAFGWRDEGYGAIAADPTQPYGNGDVLFDIALLLGVTLSDANDENSQAQRQHLAELHRGTLWALQIIMSTGQFQPGRYQRVGHTKQWQRCAEHQQQSVSDAEIDLQRRWALVDDPDCPPEVLTSLIYDPSVRIRKAVAAHPNTPAETLVNLIDDSDARVRAVVVKNTNCPEHIRLLGALTS